MVVNVLQHGAYISERLDLGLISTMFLDLLSVDIAKITVRSNEKARARREACEHRRISGGSVDRKYVVFARYARKGLYSTSVSPQDVRPLDVRPKEVKPMDKGALKVRPMDVRPPDVRPLNERLLEVRSQYVTPLDVRRRT